MALVRALLAILLLLGGSAVALTAPEVRVTATVEPARATIDERISLRIRVEAEAPILVELPELADAAGQWTVLGRALVTPEKGVTLSRIWEQVYHLQPEDVGTLALPLLEVVFRRRAGDPLERLEARPPPIQIVSVMQDDSTAATPKDIGLPVALPERSRPLLGWLLVGGVVALAALAVRRRQRGHAVSPDASPPPEVVALAELDRLALTARDAPDRAAAVIADAAETVRRFLEAGQGLPATRRTTEELQRALPEDSSALGTQRPNIKALLEWGDAVKFAQAVPSAGMVGAVLDHAREIVRGLGRAGSERPSPP